LVLQHPNERKRKTMSTVPLLPLTLANVEVKVGYSFDAATLAPVRDAVVAGRRPLLLFPGPDAVLLDDPSALSQATGAAAAAASAPGLLANNDPVLLVLIDGTWSEARAVARASPSVLAACSQVAFAGDALEPLYGDVRREPSAECVSTLEAACRCLRLLEPGSAAVHTATAHLEASMRSLVRQQLGCVPDGAPRSSGLNPKQRQAALAEERRAAAEDVAADR
jgi:DTW domain-containing protein YfiP